MSKEARDVYGFIYITTNLVNGKRYIGQKKFDNYNWKRYLGSGTILLRAIDKYGVENFTRNTIDIAYDKDELNELEAMYIEQYNATDDVNFYNIVPGGDAKNSIGNCNGKMVICISNGMWFESRSDASFYSGLSSHAVVDSFKKYHTKDFKNETLIFRDFNHVRLNKNICCICGRNYQYNGKLYCGHCADIYNNLNPVNRKIHRSEIKYVIDAIKDNNKVGIANINNYIRQSIDIWAYHNKADIENMYFGKQMSIPEISKEIDVPFIKSNELKYILLDKPEYAFPNFRYREKKDKLGMCEICSADIVLNNNRQKFCKYCGDRR